MLGSIIVVPYSTDSNYKISGIGKAIVNADKLRILIMINK